MKCAPPYKMTSSLSGAMVDKTQRCHATSNSLEPWLINAMCFSGSNPIVWQSRVKAMEQFHSRMIGFGSIHTASGCCNLLEGFTSKSHEISYIPIHAAVLS